MSRPVEEITAEDCPDVVQNGRIAGGMQPMAPVIESLARVIEAAGIATDSGIRFDESDACPLQPAELESRADSSRTAAQNDDVRKLTRSVVREDRLG